jgi:hypothetical protein
VEFRNLRFNHFRCQVGLFLYNFKGEFRTFVNLEASELLHLDQLPFLQIFDNVWIRVGTRSLDSLEFLSDSILYRVRLWALLV